MRPGESIAAILCCLVFVGGCGGSAEQDGGTALPRFSGVWQRTDGDYVLRLAGPDTNPDTTNALRAEYFNPTPIHVARAEKRMAPEGEQLFVELRDVGYPGSTYTLRHIAADDTLSGVYFHAGLKQSFNVTFTRVREP